MIRIFLLLSLFLPALSFADEWTNGKQIISNIIWKPGYHGFYVDPVTYHEPNGCNGKSNLYVIDPAITNEKEIDRLYSMILLAFSTGKPVHVWLTGCHYTTIPKFTGLQINK